MAYGSTTPIKGQGAASAAQIDEWFAVNGPLLAPGFAPDGKYKPAPVGLGQMIIEESRRWPEHVVNHDIVAADIAHESAFWQSRIVRDKNNPSGLGATNDDPYGGAKTFSTPREGIRATVAHMLTYAVGDGPWRDSDPRFNAVKSAGWLGSAPRLRDLNGKWAYPGTSYGQSIAAAANRLLETDAPMSAQIPGFLWVPARSDHYDKGRTEKIRGGAQHYTAGVNSLDYLTWSSGADDPKKRVSANFLVKHNPTLHDRGWQLVRIEDTPWTTAFANDYTVSIEYEHMGGPVTHEAYIVLAQTWIDIAAYVKEHNLGEIRLDRTGIKGHKEWVGNPSLTCPDGIDVDTLVGVIHDLQKTPQEPVGAPRITTTVPEPGGEANPWHKGYWLPVEFADYIERHGFMTVGYAVSEAFEEDGLIVQYFERARLEIHPGQVIMAGLVGAEALWARHPNRRPPVRS